MKRLRKLEKLVTLYGGLTARLSQGLEVEEHRWKETLDSMKVELDKWSKLQQKSSESPNPSSAA